MKKGVSLHRFLSGTRPEGRVIGMLTRRSLSACFMKRKDIESGLRRVATVCPTDPEASCTEYIRVKPLWGGGP